MVSQDLQSRLARVEALVQETEDQLRQQRAATHAVATEPADRLVLALRELTTVVRDLASQSGQASPSRGENH